MSPDVVAFAMDVLARAARRRELCTCGRDWRDAGGSCDRCAGEASTARTAERHARYRHRLATAAAAA